MGVQGSGASKRGACHVAPPARHVDCVACGLQRAVRVHPASSSTRLPTADSLLVCAHPHSPAPAQLPPHLCVQRLRARQQAVVSETESMLSTAVQALRGNASTCPAVPCRAAATPGACARQPINPPSKSWGCMQVRRSGGHPSRPCQRRPQLCIVRLPRRQGGAAGGQADRRLQGELLAFVGSRTDGSAATPAECTTGKR